MAENRPRDRVIVACVFVGNLFINIFMQVGPHDAVSNLSQWVEFIFHARVRWLEPKAIDIYGRPITLCLTIIFGVWFCSPWLVAFYRWSAGIKQAEEPVFITASVEQLLDRISGLMPSDAQKIAAPFKGKWLKVSGPLESVSDTLNDQLLVRLVDPPASRVQMFFNSGWRGRLELLMRGQPVKIAGRIVVISEGHVWLENCELLAP